MKQSRYARKLANRRGMYGKVAGMPSCCANALAYVEVDYKNNKRRANATVKKGGPRFTQIRTPRPR